MPRFKPVNANDPNYWDANQVVAYNFREIRKEFGWTQEFTAKRLESHLGQRLKKASISAIETSVNSDRRRVFNAQELAAFALTFGVPIIWFLMPPPIPGLSLAGTESSLINFWTLIIGEDDQQGFIKKRVAALYEADSRETRSAATRILGFGDLVTFEHFEARRFNAAIDMIHEEHNELDEIFDKMRETVEAYDKRAHRFRMHSDSDRKAYTKVSRIVLGQRIWSSLRRRFRSDHRWSNFSILLDHEDVPWENIVNTDDQKVEEALVSLFEAIAPDVGNYFSERFGPPSDPD